MAAFMNESFHELRRRVARVVIDNDDLKQRAARLKRRG
jgi:hypothetical protein